MQTRLVTLTVCSLAVLVVFGAAVPAAAQTAATAPAATGPLAPQQQTTDAAAQNAVARSFTELSGRVEPGDTVYVTRDAGERTKATLQGFDADLGTIFLNADGTSFGLTEGEHRQLELRYADSLANGAIIGAVAGSSLFIIGGIACALVNDCHAASETFAAAAVFGGIGAGIGVGIDAAIKTERLVYVAPMASGRPLALHPVFSGTRRGAVLVLRF